MSTPKSKMTCGSINATEWDNGKFSSWQFTNSYKDKDGKWQNGNSIPDWELPNLATLVNAIAQKSAVVARSQNPAPAYLRKENAPSAQFPQGKQGMSEDDNKELPF